jgi:hypothetical protein
MLRLTFAALVSLFALAGPAAAAAPPVLVPPDLRADVVADDLGIANVVPTWGAQIPKVVYDGHWYYAATLDGAGSQYPWQARIWKSRNGQSWSEAARLPGHVYQPPGLAIDAQGDLFLQVGCYTGAPCYPGVEPAPGADLGAVYTVRLLFRDHGPDGSVDFSSFDDLTVRQGTTERYYMGMAVDPTGRYVYTAYAVDGWDVWFNVLDTQTEQDTLTRKVGSPPAGHAWLYFRVQPGLQPGEVYLGFEQYVLGTPNSAYLDAALLLKSTDGGSTFPEQRILASAPNTDGNLNWVDASDITVDANDQVHAVFYVRKDGVSTLYYQQGLDGTPVAVGPYDNHSQLLVKPDGERLVFSSDDAGRLVAARSSDGNTWTEKTYALGDYQAFWPNLLEARSGSLPPPSLGVGDRAAMLLAARRPGESAFTTLLLVRYGHP